MNQINTFLYTIALATFSNSVANANPVIENHSKPNIVVLLADDLGVNELGCYGGKNVETPNIDRLASEGMLFTNNYASCAMSVPIRASLYTGLYPMKHGAYQNHKESYPNIKSVVTYLSELGYRVGRAGKQHTSPRNVYPFEEIPGFTENCVSKTANYNIDGIQKFVTRNKNTPFCLFVCSINSHKPWTWGDPSIFNPDKITLPPNSVDTQEVREHFCKYLAEIQAFDQEVGDIYALLENNGLLEYTLIILLSEQGPAMPFGKWTCYRYGQHSALIARYPSFIKAGTVTDALVQYEDILPTLYELAGGGKLQQVDGHSFLNILYGDTKQYRNYVYGLHNNIPEGTSYSIRSIQNKKYKLIINLNSSNTYFEKHLMNINDPKQEWKFWLEAAKQNEHAKWLVERYQKRPEIELYDIENDPWELNNIASDSQNASIIKTMKEQLEIWMAEQQDEGLSVDREFEQNTKL